MSEKTIPNPGSDAAIAMGCTCPVLDNGHGRRNDGRFVYSWDCPVHGPKSGDENDGNYPQ